MSWLIWNPRPQLDRIEKTTEHLEVLATRIDRRTIHMSQQEAELNEALVSFFAALNDGLARIEAKLAEAAPQVDLTDEIQAVKAAQEAFTSRVDVDVSPPPSG